MKQSKKSVNEISVLGRIYFILSATLLTVIFSFLLFDSEKDTAFQIGAYILFIIILLFLIQGLLRSIIWNDKYKKVNLSTGEPKVDNIDQINRTKTGPDLHELAFMSSVCKDYDSAVGLCDLILETDPKNSQALSQRAMSLENLGYYIDAIKDYENYLELNPEDANMYGLCGICYSRVGEDEKAKYLLEIAVNKGMKIYQPQLMMYDIIGEEFFERKRKDIQEEGLKRRGPDTKFGINTYIVNYEMLLDKFKESFKEFEAIISMDPDNKELQEIYKRNKKYFDRLS